MTVAARDPWADAWQVATQPELDRDVAALRRRIWLQRVSVMVGLLGLLLVAAFALGSVLTPDTDYLWPTPWAAVVVGFSMAGVALVVMCVASIRARGRGPLERSFLGPEDFLDRAERAWVRTRIDEGKAVPPERHAVVVAAARRMRADGGQVGNHVGLLLLYVGMVVAAPLLPIIVVFVGLAGWMGVRAVRGLTWSRRAGRWLAQNS